ncbi:MAG: penicillin-binding transpeptidase domain-containing protein, partial [Chloroflexota bacterium]|nr:penicillin-binding transpeptidase domain-containing protein [Chloroflexota bacterium]
SCDVYFYNVGVSAGQRRSNGKINHYYDYNTITKVSGDVHDFGGLGIDKIHKALTKRFWFGHITGIDLPVETAGLIGSDEWKRETYDQQGWSIGDTVNASIGQGFIEASPLQMAMNTAALANGGRIYKPRIVQSIVDDNGNVLQEFAPVVKRRTKIDEEHLRIVREAMRKVVNDPSGTAHVNADGTSKWSFTNPEGEEPIIIAGKTGTAEFAKFDDVRQEWWYDSHAWFAMFAPFDDPEVAIVAFVESGGEGSTNAVPICDKAYRAYLEVTGQRPRGKVLREDGQPINAKVLGPLDDPNAGKLEKDKKDDKSTPESDGE